VYIKGQDLIKSVAEMASSKTFVSETGFSFFFPFIRHDGEECND
jgi:hypothetical protein